MMCILDLLFSFLASVRQVSFIFLFQGRAVWNLILI